MAMPVLSNSWWTFYGGSTIERFWHQGAVRSSGVLEIRGGSAPQSTSGCLVISETLY